MGREELVGLSLKLFLSLSLSLSLWFVFCVVEVRPLLTQEACVLPSRGSLAVCVYWLWASLIVLVSNLIHFTFFLLICALHLKTSHLSCSYFRSCSLESPACVLIGRYRGLGRNDTYFCSIVRHLGKTPPR